MRTRGRIAGTTRAFSLTELLVVITIILILMTLLVVGIEQIYGRAIMTKCQHRLEQIGHSIQMYSSQSHGMLPRSWDMYTGNLWYQTLGNTYLDNWNVLACPSVGEPPELAAGGGGVTGGGRETSSTCTRCSGG